jgi:formylglycine-generating enzyme
MKQPEDVEQIVSSIGARLKLIPPGEFLMGSPDSEPDPSTDQKPQHLVHILRPFYLGVYQVTRGEFRRFVEAVGYRTEAEKDGKGGYGWVEVEKKWVQDPRFDWMTPGFEQTDEHPVVNVSWNDAFALCNWLSQEEGQRFRLPTEAEWEYACRARTTTRFSFGDDESALVMHGWYQANSSGRTHRVGRKPPNAFDLHDMHGNVWEWCWDWYDGDYYKESPLVDPRGPEEPMRRRVFRGGSWFNGSLSARSMFRRGGIPQNRDSAMGMRLARESSSP